MALIEVENLTHVYLRGTPTETTAVRDVTLRIEEGEFVALIGPTGSGKSTLVQHFNALLKPTAGRVRIGGHDLSDSKTDLRAVRHRVGMLFQYAEYQLFEETVEKDVAFGPRNMGLPDDEIRARVRNALESVGLNPGTFGPRSPFTLSGGEMRRVAMAGVLAMTPRALVLDEPAAGLDPRGKAEILGEIRSLHDRDGITVVFITHSMEEAAAMASRVVVMERGRVTMDGPTREIFARAEELRAIGLGVPEVTALARDLRSRGIRMRTDVLTLAEAHRAIREALQWN